jgi:hypothetical protein
VLDPALDNNGLVIRQRLDDPRLIAVTQDRNPLDPRGPDCLSCPPFAVTIMDRRTNREVRTIRMLEYGFAKDESAAISARMIADRDGDGTEDLLVGVPLARGKDKTKRAGAVLLISAKTGRVLGRIDGRSANTMLGADLGLRDKHTLMAGTSAANKASGAVYVIDLEGFKLLKILRDAAK